MLSTRPAVTPHATCPLWAEPKPGPIVASLDELELLAPCEPTKIVAIGRNYAAHAVEMGHDPDREPPFFFQKNPDNLDPSGQFPYPVKSGDVHHEAELAVMLSSGGTDIAVIGLAPDGSVIGAAPSGAPDDPDPLPVLDPTDIERLQAGETPFTVGGNDGYRVTAVVSEGEQITVVLAQPLDDVALTMRQTLLVLLVVGAGSSVVLGGAVWFFIRSELEPLDGMAETADRITEGDLSKRVVIDRPSNEVGRLGGALNSMLGRIEDVAGFLDALDLAVIASTRAGASAGRFSFREVCRRPCRAKNAGNPARFHVRRLFGRCDHPGRHHRCLIPGHNRFLFVDRRHRRHHARSHRPCLVADPQYARTAQRRQYDDERCLYHRWGTSCCVDPWH